MVIEDSIRQGRTLSDAEFGLLIDELNKEIRTTELEVQYSIFICVVFKDDLTLLAGSVKELQ